MARSNPSVKTQRTLAGLVLFLCVGSIPAAIGMAGGISQVAQSNYVQAHGQRDTATVVHVDNTQDRSSYTATVTVRLQSPVDGTTSSVVHVPYQDNSSAGDKITVLVDPSQPGYSEIPGAPSATASAWAVYLVFLVIFLGLAVLFGFLFVRSRRRARAAGAFAMRSSPA